ncbi:MAG TPA: HAD family hydrolase [Candidatus Bathyarchaeia archaeon]|nr:HAD family hydrolase [Candidatus Bathyarchaeia archaeon]
MRYRPARPLRDILRTIIFDMDGTLVSSLSCIQHCVNTVCQKYVSRSLTLEETISHFGPPARTIIKMLTSDLADAFQNQAISDYYECYRTNVSQKVIAFPGIMELLAKIRRSRNHLALLTGVERILMNYTLDAFDISKFFEARISSDDVENSKPHPEGVNLILRNLKSKSKETMLVGDSPADILAGKSAGVMTAAALWSPENRGDPTTEHPDYEFRSVQQLSDFLFAKEKTEEYGVYLAPSWSEE